MIICEELSNNKGKIINVKYNLGDRVSGVDMLSSVLFPDKLLFQGKIFFSKNLRVHKEEPDILECEVKWALGTITTNKASRCDGISAELFQVLKDDIVKVLLVNSKFGKLSSGHRTGKDQFSFNPEERQCQRMFKLPHNCAHFTC